MYFYYVFMTIMSGNIYRDEFVYFRLNYQLFVDITLLPNFNLVDNTFTEN